MSTSKEYRLIALSVGGLNNKVFRRGDGQRIFEHNFEPGAAEELVKKGFLEPAEKSGEKPASEPDEEVTSEEKMTSDFSEYSVKELKKMLEEKGISFPQNASKQHLLDLLK